jgi:hypothetical protein
MKLSNIRQYVLAKKYEEATALLVELNKDFVEYGNFDYIHL